MDERRFKGIGIDSIPHVKGHHCSDNAQKEADGYYCKRCGKPLAHYLGR